MSSFGNGRSICKISNDHSVSKILLFSDDTQIISGDTKGVIKIWDLQDGVEVQRFDGHHDKINDLKFSNDGRFLISGSDYETAKIWRLVDEVEISSFSALVFFKMTITLY